MSEQIRVGVAGLTHGHVWGLIDSWKGVPEAHLVAVADATPLLDNAKKDFDRHYTDWREMLEKEQLDALVVTSDNVESAEITVQALKKGIPCMVEKAMAANAKDADRMLAAMRESGKLLVINWPIALSPWLHDLKARLDRGEIGHAFHFRFRIGHHGPKEIGCDEYFVGWLYDEAKNGGGAIADFCGYGAALARYFFGMPETVYALRGNYTKDYDVCDDHAVCLLKYPKMSAQIEGTWATFGFDPGPNPVVHGKTGTLSVEGNTIIHSVAGKEAEKVPAAELAFKSPAAYFVHLLKTGEKPMGIHNPEVAADACRILDAAIKSTTSGCAERP